MNDDAMSVVGRARKLFLVMGRMNRSRKLVALLLAFQVWVGYAGLLTRESEIFPFTCWFMFSLVPNRRTDYDLLLYGTASDPQQPARTFSDSGARIRAPHSVELYRIVQQLGAAVEKGDAARIAYLRARIEEQFTVPDMRYELLEETYLPVERWKTGQLLSCRRIRSFIATAFPLEDPDPMPPLKQETGAVRTADELPVQL